LLCGFEGSDQANRVVTTPYEYPQQFSAKEPVGSRDKRGWSCAGFHAGSVEWQTAGEQRQNLHRTPTKVLRS